MDPLGEGNYSMTAKPKNPRTSISSDKAQVDRFKQTARELGCDETGEAFEKAFSQVAPPRTPQAKPQDKR